MVDELKSLSWRLDGVEVGNVSAGEGESIGHSWFLFGGRCFERVVVGTQTPNNWQTLFEEDVFVNLRKILNGQLFKTLLLFV